jgi:prepilin-type N-terminal cleavage/methylation domain-containing protein
MEQLAKMKNANEEKGFSLIEILIAVAILAVVCLGIMALLPSGYKQITNAGRTATLDHIAQMQLDYLRSIPISHNDLTAGHHPTSPNPNVNWPMPNGATDKYSVYWIVTDYTPMTNSKAVRVYVGYDMFNSDGTAKASDAAIVQKTKVFTTMITQ